MLYLKYGNFSLICYCLRPSENEAFHFFILNIYLRNASLSLGRREYFCKYFQQTSRLHKHGNSSCITYWYGTRISHLGYILISNNIMLKMCTLVIDLCAQLSHIVWLYVMQEYTCLFNIFLIQIIMLITMIIWCL